jgi:glutathione peroxidase
MKLTKRLGKNAAVISNTTNQLFQTPIHTLSVPLNNGKMLPLQELKGKKLLLVNTASDCGYTAQYSELQQLQEQYRDTLQVIGFPANDFKEQEKGSDEAIAQFCQVNFGVTFPLAKKSTVVKGPQQHPVYRWLTQKEQNGWNDKAPSWNFSKYLVDETGVLTHYFDPSVAPLGPEIKAALEK